MTTGNRAAPLLAEILATVAVAMIHRPGEDALPFLLLALPVMAMAPASATVTAVATLALLTLTAMSSRTPAGRTPASAASPAFTPSGTSGRVIRSYIHVALVFRYYPLYG